MNSFAKIASNLPISEQVGSLNVAEALNDFQTMRDAEERPSFLNIHSAANVHRAGTTPNSPIIFFVTNIVEQYFTFKMFGNQHTMKPLPRVF